MVRVSALSLAVALAACGGGGGAPVAGLQISEVALYQGVKTQLMANGQANEQPSVPIVRGRYGFVRVFVTPQADWQERLVGGQLEVFDGDRRLATVTATPVSIRAQSSDSALDSTINFDVPGEHFTQGFRWAVKLTEAGGPGKPTGTTTGGFFPATGSARAVTRDLGKRLKVVLVPFRYKADGSNRVPDTSPLAVQRYRNLMFATYPVPKVDMTVRDVVDLDVNVSAGRGFSQTLDVLLRLRASDRVGVDVYYYGIFNPAPSYSQFCQGGCVLGISSGSPSASDASVRGSIGVAFEGAAGYQPESTFIHEVGHAHGRQHTPCGLGGQPADRNYPHSGAKLGAWGYDATSKRLVNPDNAKDYMSYCDPPWTSDYTYLGMMERIATVNASIPEGQLLTARERHAYRMLRLTERGLLLGSRVELEDAPTGEKVRLQRADKSGVARSDLTAVFHPYNHIAGGIVFVREAQLRGVARVGLGAHSLSLSGALAKE